VGQCKYLPLTTPGGGILNDPLATRLGENHFWLSIADRDIHQVDYGIVEDCRVFIPALVERLKILESHAGGVDHVI
jgi:glycine cleavage system aminomethyltransferase T